MEIIMSNKYIPLTITKQYDGTECTYTLTKVTPNKVIPNKDTTATIKQFDAAFFKLIINKYFALGQNEKCSSAEIQTVLRENAKCDDDLWLAGFNFTLSNLQYCPQYRSFLNYIKSLDGVSEVRFNENGVRNRGFKGIKLKEDPMEMYNNERLNEDDTSEMDL